MANVYVDSTVVGGTGDGTTWANAYTSYETAVLAGGTGNTYWVWHLHNESKAGAMALTSAGTPAAPNRTFCVNVKNSPPTVADLVAVPTASVGTTLTNQMTMAGYMQCWGMIFLAGTSTSSSFLNLAGTVAHNWSFDTCTIGLGGSGSAGTIQLGSTSINISYMGEWKNTGVSFANIAQGIISAGVYELIWRDTAAPFPNLVPTTLFPPGAVGRGLLVNGWNLDLSGMAAKTIIGAHAGNSKFLFERCAIAANTTKGTTPTSRGPELLFVNCDSSQTNYKFEKWRYTGTQTPEPTIIRTGSEATNRITPASIKIVTTANARLEAPFVSTPMKRFNEVEDTPITVIVYGIGASVPDNSKVWLEVDYFSAAGTPLGSVSSTRVASILTTPAAGSSDTSVWGGSTAAFKLSATFTPTQPGTIVARVCVGEASATYYIDPVPFISGQPIYRAWAA